MTLYLPEQLSVQQQWLVIQTHAWSARSESSDVGWLDPGSVEAEYCRAGIDPGSASPSAPWWPSCNENKFGARLFCQLGIFPTSVLSTSNFILSWKNRVTETLVAKSQLTQIPMTECHWGIWVTFYDSYGWCHFKALFGFSCLEFNILDFRQLKSHLIIFSYLGFNLWYFRQL